MELRDYLNVARRHWRLITATALLTLCISGFMTARETPQYAAKSRVFVSTTPNDSSSAYQGGLFSEQRVGSYADIVKGVELAERVVADLGLAMSAPTLASKIQASVVPDTVLIDVTVTDSNPRLAMRINASVLRQLTEFVEELETPPGKKNPLLKVTVIDPPREPSSPVSPRPTRNLGLGLILGLLLGFGLAVVRELLDNSVKSAEDVPEVADIPVLAQMPEDPDVATEPLITSLDSHAPRLEAFRVLRTNLQFVDVDSQSKAMVFTSSLPGEGKSTTSLNAALAMAQAGRRVLLVDADMRRPQVARMLGLEESVGLTTVLLGRVTFQDAVQLHAPSGLHVLTAGVIPPNPAELLQSHAMADVIARARENFDVILFDAPPLLPVTDAALIAAQTDGAVLVIRHGKTSKDQVASAVERLASVDATPLGLVFNMVPRKRTEGYGYGYGYAPEQPLTASSRTRRLPQRGERKSTTLRRRGARSESPGAAEQDTTAVVGERANPEPLRGSRPTVIPTPPHADPLSEPFATTAADFDEPTPLADALSLPHDQTAERPLGVTSDLEPRALEEDAADGEWPDADTVEGPAVDADPEADGIGTSEALDGAADAPEPVEDPADADHGTADIEREDVSRSPLAWAFARDEEEEDPSVSAWARRDR